MNRLGYIFTIIALLAGGLLSTATAAFAASGASVSPSSLAFGNQVVGTTSAAQNVVLTNTGTVSLNISGITITGANANQFSQTNGCPAHLAKKAHCTISVKFSPTLAQTDSASLSISDDAPGSPQLVSLSGTGTSSGVGGGTGLGPKTAWHFTANGNFASGGYDPGAYGFNVADASPSQLSLVPTGDKALVWVGMCDGVTSAFTSIVDSTYANAKVFGYYLVDEPDPYTDGRYGTYCNPANLMAESDYIHAKNAALKTFIIEQNMASSTAPFFGTAGSSTPFVPYNPSTTHIDSFGVDPYPCRTEVTACGGYSMIGNYVNAVQTAGVPLANIVPVYQAFGTWAACGGDDGGGDYQLPTAAQETDIMNTWAGLVPTPAWDYAYSWGTQCGDTALSVAPSDLKQVFATHNAP